MSHFRYYQALADEAITKHLLHENKCLVKMFCGTGKSKLMRETHINKDKELIVYVFPSLALIDQFYNDYLTDANVLRISSEKDSTTDPQVIKKFLTKKKKIICVTYNSFKTLIDNLNGHKIQVCHYDEAHHAVGETYQRLIFDNDCEKQIFYTATPKNANGIIMYDSDKPETGMCGKMVYDYSYLSGVNEGYLNPIEIRIDMYLKNENRSVFESIARAVLQTGNNRVLTFHSDVNTDRDTSVNNFVNEEEFIKVFKEVQEQEFPKVKKYKKIMMVGLSASLKGKQRSEILKRFEKSGSDVMVISSCETIGEGIDTKNANMCVFVDPKTSYVKIIQNIGRIVRKIFGEEKPNSTVLIPCWVDKEKYLGCGGDKEKCDEVIRQDMSEGGNFNGILNVLSALKQEDEEIYDLCLHYPDSYSPQEISNHLEQHGYTIGEPGELNEVLESLLDTDLESDELMDIAEDEDVCIEVYTHSLENPVETYNPEAEEIVRVYQTEEGEYCPVTKRLDKEKRTSDRIPHPNREHRVNLKVHTHPDIKVLWNITSDITGDICSCIIDCEVVKYDPMEAAIGIVERAKERVANGGKLLPRQIHNKNNRKTIVLEEENNDAIKLSYWKCSIKGTVKGVCNIKIITYLDEELKGWRDELDFDEKAMKDAEGIVERAKKRESNGENILPRNLNKNKINTIELVQEYKDANKLHRFKSALKGVKNIRCCKKVTEYLDEQLKGWRDELDFDEKAMKDAEGIVERAKKRESNGENILPRNLSKNKRSTIELIQEYKDARKIGMWKGALKGMGSWKCCGKVSIYLDEHLPGWRDEMDEKSMKDAEGIVERAKERESRGENLLPRRIRENEDRTEFDQEHNDSMKIRYWKGSIKGNDTCKCFKYLDEHLPGWRDDLDEKAMKYAEDIVERAKERELRGENLLPKSFKKENRIGFEKEHKDSQKLSDWKFGLKGRGTTNCTNEVRDYLDEHLPGWRDDLDEKAMKDAEAIVKRAKERVSRGENLLPISKRDGFEEQHKDANKLGRLKSALKGTSKGKCPDQVRDYLDENLPGWRTETKSMKSKEPKESKVKKESSEQKRERVKSELSDLHKKYKTLTSDNLRKLFADDPSLWLTYHSISEENEKSFPEDGIPRNRIIRELNKIKTNRQRVVVDMGCGKAQISEFFKTDTRFKFINYDHIKSNETVISCDISRIPLNDDSVEICILSLAMWGSNCKSYISEAYRVLESGGKLYMIEPTKRWTETTNADRLKSLLHESGFKIIEESIEKFCLFECIKK
jgi:superfamily II DNA or RNA helicase/ribosome modulation factor